MGDEKVPIFIRGGRSVVVQNMKEDDVNTVDMKDNNFSLLIALDEEGNTSKGSVYIDDGLSVDADYGYVEILTEKVSEGNYKISFITEKKGTIDEISVHKIVLIGDGLIETMPFDTPLKLGKNDFEIYTKEKPEEDTTTESPTSESSTTESTTENTTTEKPSTESTTTSASSILKFTALSIIVNLFFK